MIPTRRWRRPGVAQTADRNRPNEPGLNSIAITTRPLCPIKGISGSSRAVQQLPKLVNLDTGDRNHPDQEFVLLPQRVDPAKADASILSFAQVVYCRAVLGPYRIQIKSFARTN